MFSGVGQNLAKVEKLLQHNHVVAPRLEAATMAPGNEFRGEKIRADRVRNLVHQWKSSKGQDFSRLLSSYSGRTTHTNFWLRKLPWSSEISTQYLKCVIAWTLSSTSYCGKTKWLSDHVFRFTLMEYIFLWWSEVTPDKAHLHSFWRDFSPLKGKNDLFFLANYSINYT